MGEETDGNVGKTEKEDKIEILIFSMSVQNCNTCKSGFKKPRRLLLDKFKHYMNRYLKDMRNVLHIFAFSLNDFKCEKLIENLYRNSCSLLFSLVFASVQRLLLLNSMFIFFQMFLELEKLFNWILIFVFKQLRI